MSDVRALLERALPPTIGAPDIALVERRARRRERRRRVVGVAGVFALLAGGLALSIPSGLERGVEFGSGAAASGSAADPAADPALTAGAVPLGSPPPEGTPPAEPLVEPSPAVQEEALVASLPAAPIAGRINPFSVWTGEELVVLGGGDASGGNPTDGARFDPVTGTWREVPAPPQPTFLTSVLTADRKVLAVGSDLTLDALTATGAAPQVRASLFDLDAGTWTELPASPLSARAHPVVAYTGDEVIVVGGQLTQGNVRALQDGAVYDLATASWRATAPAPEALVVDASVWTGRELVLAGYSMAPDGTGEQRWLAYDPEADTWRQFPAVPSHVNRVVAIGDHGQDLVTVTEVYEGDLELGEVGKSTFLRYDAAAGAWRDLGPAPHDVNWLAWSGDRVLARGPVGPLYALDPVSGELAAFPDPALPGRSEFEGAALTWAGDRVMSWGGVVKDAGGTEGLANDGYTLQPPRR